MSKLEQFGLFTGLLGLVSDAIALGTFVLGFWTLQSTDTSVDTMANLFITLTGFFIFYGWFMVSWFLIRRRIVSRRQEEKNILGKLIEDTVPSIGFLVSPIFIFWIFSITTIYYSVDAYVPQARIEATRVAKIILTPTRTRTPGTISYTPTPIIEKSVDEIVYDMRTIKGITFGFLAGGVFIYTFIGFFFTVCINSLMPVVYSDIDILHMDTSEPPEKSAS